MKSNGALITPPDRCQYLPNERWQFEHEEFEELSRGEYEARLRSGWRRFGYSAFRPSCAKCSACWSLRVLAGEFRPSRTDARLRRQNEPMIELVINPPEATPEKMALYRHYHIHQSAEKGWPYPAARDLEHYFASFVVNPFATQEWCYFLDSQLVGVGYVDELSDGLSAIYFFYDPDLKKLSLGTWNILTLLERARSLSLPYVYLGYYVAGSRSMKYKARFRPAEILRAGKWQRLVDAPR